MYYLGQGSKPVPAEAPYLGTVDGRHEWEYAQKQHRAAIMTVKGMVDNGKPRSINPHLRDMQQRSRIFCEGQKRAEIGRENRKLVDRLAYIEKGLLAEDPRAPPTVSTQVARSQPLGGSLPPPMPSVGSISAPISSLSGPKFSVAESSRSLNEQARRKTQRAIEQDNASLVRRILTTRPTMNIGSAEKDFRRHQRASQILRRVLPEPEPQRRQRSLPPLRSRSFRPASLSAPLGGRAAQMTREDGLFFFTPADLQRSESGPVTLHAATAPLPSGTASAVQDDPSFSSDPSSADRSLSPQKSAADAPGSASPVPRGHRGSGGPPGAGGLLGANGPPDPAQAPRHDTSQQRRAPPLKPLEGVREADASTWPHVDVETERRQWVEDKNGAQYPGDRGPDPPRSKTPADADYFPGVDTGVADWETDTPSQSGALRSDSRGGLRASPTSSPAPFGVGRAPSPVVDPLGGLRARKRRGLALDVADGQTCSPSPSGATSRSLHADSRADSRTPPAPSPVDLDEADFVATPLADASGGPRNRRGA